METHSESRNGLDVSVILPALNEERTIGECITKIQKVFQDNAINGEIIVADSSSDRTGRLQHPLEQQLSKRKRTVMVMPILPDSDMQRVVIIVMGDADNTYDFLEIPKLLAPSEEWCRFCNRITVQRDNP